MRERSTIGRRALFIEAAALPVAGAGLSAATSPKADAELIRLCAEHIANRDAYNRSTVDLEPEDDSLWHAYERTHNAINTTPAHTLAGMVAKARAAKAEALTPDGSEKPENCAAADFAWGLVNDLLRMGSHLPAPEV